MSSWSALSIYADAAILANGQTVSATEENTERDNNRDWDIDVRAEGIATERHHNSASEPDDTSDGVIWSDSGNTLLKWRNGGAWENVAIATNANTFTGIQTISNSTDASSTTTGALIVTGGVGIAKSIRAGGTIFTEKGGGGSTFHAGTYSSTTTDLSILVFRRSHADVVGTATETVDGEFLGAIFYQGVTSSSGFATAAQIKVIQRGSAGGAQVPADITFQTATASAGAAIRAAITTEGNLSIGPAVNAQPNALVGGILISNGTAEDTALTNGCSAWADDDGASLSEWVFMSEGLTKYHMGGSADEDLQVPGVVDKQDTAVGNVGAGEDDLMSYTMPADLLDVDAKAIRVTGFGLGNGADNVTLKFHFGGTTITMNSGSAVGTWYATIIVMRTGATTQTGMSHFSIGTSSAAKLIGPSETLSGTVVIKFTGENTTDTTNDAVTQTGMIVEIIN